MILGAHVFWIAAIALILDAVFGEPDWLWRRWPHPAVLMGRLIDTLDRTLNLDHRSAATRRWLGVAALLILVATAGLTGALLSVLSASHPVLLTIEGLVVAILIAQRSLYDHVAAVRNGFQTGGLDGARKAVAMIVGRDPQTLDEAGVSRAAIESTAENFSDGITAPLFWYLIAGLPGIFIYKIINTADSMIGHRSEQYRDFGWASARIDDLLNLIPARLSGVFIAATAPIVMGSIRNALVVMCADAGKHRSPNAGWPEAAMAGALGIALAGPRIYASGRVDDPWLNETGRRDANETDIGKALNLLIAACTLQALIVFGLALISF